MTKFLDDGVHKMWHRFLLEWEMAKSYHLPYLLIGTGHTFRNPLLEFILPTLLYVKVTGILDESLKRFISIKGIPMPKSKYRRDLNGRIECLNDAGHVSQHKTLQEIRERRNELAHEVQAQLGWGQLDTDVIVIERELQHLGFIGERAKYEYFGERSAMRESSDPKVAFERSFEFGVKKDGKVSLSISFDQKLHRIGS